MIFDLHRSTIDEMFYKKLACFCCIVCSRIFLVLHREKVHACSGILWQTRLASCFVLDYICQEQVVDEELESLVLASDGLWDVVANEVRFSSLLLNPIT